MESYITRIPACLARDLKWRAGPAGIFAIRWRAWRLDLRCCTLACTAAFRRWRRLRAMDFHGGIKRLGVPCTQRLLGSHDATRLIAAGRGS